MPDKERMGRIERKLDRWLKQCINDNNVYEATYQLLDAVPGDMKKSWPDGYCEGGGWRYKDQWCEMSHSIAKLDKTEERQRIWGKWHKLVLQMYKCSGDAFILSYSGCLDLYLKESVKTVRKLKLKPGDNPLFCILAIEGIALTCICNWNMMVLTEDPEGTKNLLESLISRVLSIIPEDHHFTDNDLYLLKDCVEVFLLRRLPVPKKLQSAAHYMLQRDEKRMQEVKDEFEKKTAKLKDHTDRLRALMAVV